MWQKQYYGISVIEILYGILNTACVCVCACVRACVRECERVRVRVRVSVSVRLVNCSARVLYYFVTYINIDLLKSMAL